MHIIKKIILVIFPWNWKSLWYILKAASSDILISKIKFSQNSKEYFCEIFWPIRAWVNLYSDVYNWTTLHGWKSLGEAVEAATFPKNKISIFTTQMLVNNAFWGLLEWILE